MRGYNPDKYVYIEEIWYVSHIQSPVLTFTQRCRLQILEEACAPRLSNYLIWCSGCNVNKIGSYTLGILGKQPGV